MLIRAAAEWWRGGGANGVVAEGDSPGVTGSWEVLDKIAPSF
jgi:hypothetical protein